MRIALVVQGRFHAFDLAVALAGRKHTVRVLTNYPAWAAEQFGLKASQVSSFVVHGVLARAAEQLRGRVPSLYPEAALHQMFGRWAAQKLQRETWDIVHPWSSVAYEALTQRQKGTRYLLMRGSAHIRTQQELLMQEEARTHTRQDKPSDWMIGREELEYARADEIVTLSTFAQRTFLERGFEAAHVWNVPLAASVAQFRPSKETVEARATRILAGEPLRILYVGALSFQKGLWDFAEMVRALDKQKFQVRCVGPITPEAEGIVAQLKASGVEIVGKVPQAELPAQYAWGDVFVYPTIQDGYAQVLAQAQVSGLPLISTINSGAPDLVQEGKNGWLVPIRSPQIIVERLNWCDQHRAELGAMVQVIAFGFQPRTWDDVARDFERMCEQVVAR